MKSLARVTLCAGSKGNVRGADARSNRERRCREEDPPSWSDSILDLDRVPGEDLNDGGANPSSSWVVNDDGMRR
jgi:hypothetical protein